MPTVSRRNLLARSIPSVAIAAPLILTPRKSSAFSLTKPDPATVFGSASCTHTLYNCLTQNSQLSVAYAWRYSATSTLMSNLTGCGTVGVMATAAASYMSSVNKVPPFNSNLQALLKENSDALGWQLPLSVFSLRYLTQPNLSQLGVIINVAAIQYLVIQYGRAMQAMSATPNLISRVNDPNRSFYVKARSGTTDRSLAASAAGGVAVAAGTGMMLASGTTAAGLSTAGIAAFSMFTGGAALVVLGLGFAMYYGYQAIEDNWGPPSSSVGGSALRLPYEIQDFNGN